MCTSIDLDCMIQVTLWFLLHAKESMGRTSMVFFWRKLAMHRDQSTAKWHSILISGSWATMLRQEDQNVGEIQRMLQEFFTSGHETFASIVTFLATEISVVEGNTKLLSYVRAVLEVFVLYSITTSDSTWLSDRRTAYIGRQTEHISEIISSLTRESSEWDTHQQKDCLRRAMHLELISRREHSRAEIIKHVIGLADTMPLNIPFMLYNRDNYDHRLNATAFLKWLRPTAYYWIAMAYSLAIDSMVYDPPPIYTDG